MTSLIDSFYRAANPLQVLLHAGINGVFALVRYSTYNIGSSFPVLSTVEIFSIAIKFSDCQQSKNRGPRGWGNHKSDFFPQTKLWFYDK